MLLCIIIKSNRTNQLVVQEHVSMQTLKARIQMILEQYETSDCATFETKASLYGTIKDLQELCEQ